ncbi:MAG TPA: aspartyl-tRNA synthetase [Metabacillus sp.]|nr:aspartyl-tRNA synthetase [Metabacillus sp.]
MATEDDLLLIPAYYIEDEALFFFIKNRNTLGASFVDKGFFGWKAGTLTWSPMEDHYDEKLNGYQGHGGNLIYGIIKGGEEEGFIVKVNENEANILNLAMLPAKVINQYQLENLYIWYFESDSAIEEGEIKLINKETNQEIDVIEL